MAGSGRGNRGAPEPIDGLNLLIAGPPVIDADRTAPARPNAETVGDGLFALTTAYAGKVGDMSTALWACEEISRQEQSCGAEEPAV